MLFLWVANFFSAFPAIHYTDPPYDWAKLSETLANYKSKTTKYIISEVPSYIYDPVLYYSLLWPVGKLEIINIKDVPKYNLASKNKGNIFLLKPAESLRAKIMATLKSLATSVNRSVAL